MIDKERIKKAESDVSKYLEEFLLKKEKNETAKNMYVKNSELSLETAQRLLELEDEKYKPYLWIIVAAYYSMFYIANAVLLSLGYKAGDKISHKVTEDCLIVFVRNKLKKKYWKNMKQLKKKLLK